MDGVTFPFVLYISGTIDFKTIATAIHTVVASPNNNQEYRTSCETPSSE